MRAGLKIDRMPERTTLLGEGGSVVVRSGGKGYVRHSRPRGFRPNAGAWPLVERMHNACPVLLLLFGRGGKQ
jgi:hypothetical protein